MDLFVVLSLTALGLTLLGAVRIRESEAAEPKRINAEMSEKFRAARRAGRMIEVDRLRSRPDREQWLNHRDQLLLEIDPLERKASEAADFTFPKGSFGESQKLSPKTSAEPSKEKRSANAAGMFKIPGYESVPYMWNFKSGEEVVTAVVCKDATRIKTVTHFEFQNQAHSRVIVDGRIVAVVRGTIKPSDVECVSDASSKSIAV